MLKEGDVSLREIQRDDFDELSRVSPSDAYYSLVGEEKSASVFASPDSFAEAFEDLLQGKYLWCIIYDDRIIGTAILHHFDVQNKRARFAIGIFQESYWGKGIGTKASRLVMDFAFKSLGLKELEVRVLENNGRAIRCYEKLGFRKAEVLASGFNDAGNFYRDIRMTLARAAQG